MKPLMIKRVCETLAQHNPDPKTELRFQSHFELLIAVMLSAQATDVQVNKVTQVMYASANTPEAMIEKGEDWIRDSIKSIGLFRNKAKNVWLTCQILINQFNSQVPSDRASLESLPGVGRKTANVVLNEAFGQPTIAVDTHIFRVANRIGLANAKTPNAVEKQLLACIPKAYLKGIHHWLILHGRYVCRARSPRCQECQLTQWCRYPDKT